MGKIIYKEESYKIMGACFEVYKTMGCGFLEDVYQECLAIELKKQSIPFIEKPKLDLYYKEDKLRKHYEPDFICFEKIVLEIKSTSTLIDEHRAQLLNYLNATKFELGLLVNFGHYPKIEHERFILTDHE